MSSINQIISSIQDSSSCTIRLKLINGSSISFTCVYKEDDSTHFFLVFPPKTLPENIDFKANHPVSIRDQSSSITLNSMILEQVSDRGLRLMARGTIDPASLREYFRVNTETSIHISFATTFQNHLSPGWSCDGNTKDLSASGALALFKDEPQNSNHIVIEIFLPDKQVTVNALGHIVHKKKLRNRKWQVSFHFDNISPKHRDFVIQYLLIEQRKQLRQKVQTVD